MIFINSRQNERARSHIYTDRLIARARGACRAARARENRLEWRGGANIAAMHRLYSEVAGVILVSYPRDLPPPGFIITQPNPI